MQIRELSISDAYEITPIRWEDERGTFLEWYRFDKLSEVVGHPIALRQANTSVSKKGVVRGIHFADVPLGQAKYVTAMHGAVLDFAIDIRIGSPTFGHWDSVLLDDKDRKAIYLSEGLGHAFVALTDDAVVSYLVSDIYNPTAEHGITPQDEQVGLIFPSDVGEIVMSPKDVEAPTLDEAEALGLLPRFDDVRAFYRTLDASHRAVVEGA